MSDLLGQDGLCLFNFLSALKIKQTGLVLHEHVWPQNQLKKTISIFF